MCADVHEIVPYESQSAHSSPWSFYSRDSVLWHRSYSYERVHVASAYAQKASKSARSGRSGKPVVCARIICCDVISCLQSFQMRGSIRVRRHLLVPFTGKRISSPTTMLELGGKRAPIVTLRTNLVLSLFASTLTELHN